MKKTLDLSAVSAARADMTAAERELVAMRERLASASDKVIDAKVAITQRQEMRRQAVVTGSDTAAATHNLEDARRALAIACDDVDLLTQAEEELELAVVVAEVALLDAMTEARHIRYEDAKAELEAAISRYAPPFRTAALGVGVAWQTPGAMLADIGSRDIAIGWTTTPDELRANGHKSDLVTEDSRRRAMA